MTPVIFDWTTSVGFSRSPPSRTDWAKAFAVRDWILECDKARREGRPCPPKPRT